MKKSIALAMVAVVALNACGRSQHRAPLRRDFSRPTADKKSQDVLTQKTEKLLGSMYGSTTSFKALSASESSQKLKSQILGVSLSLEEIPNEVAAERYFLSEFSMVQKENQKCVVKKSESKVYSREDMVSKTNKSNSNLRCIDDSCEHVLFVHEVRKDVQVGPRKEIDFAVVASVLKKDKENTYSPVQINSSMISNFSNEDKGRTKCAEQVINEVASSTPSVQLDVNKIIHEEAIRQAQTGILESLAAVPQVTPVTEENF